MKRLLVATICIMTIVLFASPHVVVYADGVTRLDELADDVYQYGHKKQYEKAKQSLQLFAETFLQQKPDEAFSIDDLHMLATTYEEAKTALTAVDAAHDERIKALTRFRLAVDALVTEHEPMWKETESIVLTSFNRANEALKDGRVADFQYELSEFLESFYLVRPALAIDLSSRELAQVDAHISFLKSHQATLVYTPEKHGQLDVMKQELERLFLGEQKKDTEDPSMWWGILSVGGLILPTLIYVGWKKYKGEQWDREEKREKQSDR